MLQRITKHGEVIFLLVLILGSVYLMTVATDIPVGRSKALITPATWPLLSLGMVAGFSALLLLLRVIRLDKKDKQEAAAKTANAESAAVITDAEGKTIRVDAEGMPVEEEAVHPQRAFYTLGFLVVYLAALPYLGFVVVTLLTMGVYMLSLGAKRIYAVLIPLLMTGLVVGIFGIALKVPLPRGISLFRDLSQFFY